MPLSRRGRMVIGGGGGSGGVLTYTKVVNTSVTNSDMAGNDTSFTLTMDGAGGAPRMIASVGDGSGLANIAVKAKVEAFSLETDEWCGFGVIFKDIYDNHHFAGVHSRGSAILYSYNALSRVWDFTGSSGWTSTYNNNLNSQTAPMWIAVKLVGSTVYFYDSPDGSIWTMRQSASLTFTAANLQHFGLGLHTGWSIESDDAFSVSFSNVVYGDVAGLA